jgi:hypothetical protein
MAKNRKGRAGAAEVGEGAGVDGLASLQRTLFMDWLRNDGTTESASEKLRKKMTQQVEVQVDGEVITTTGVDAVISAYISKALSGDVSAMDRLLGAMDGEWKRESREFREGNAVGAGVVNVFAGIDAQTINTVLGLHTGHLQHEAGLEIVGDMVGLNAVAVDGATEPVYVPERLALPTSPIEGTV